MRVRCLSLAFIRRDRIGTLLSLVVFTLENKNYWLIEINRPCSFKALSLSLSLC